MPQMSPMNWLNLFYMMNFILIFLLSLNHFNKFFFYFKNKKILKNNLNWTW